MKLEVAFSSISAQPDLVAVVNSANANLRLGSGVAGAIHRAAGPELEAYCQPYAPLVLGKALLTPAFQLPNQWVIHVRVGHYLNHAEPIAILEKGLREVFALAEHYEIRSVGLPAIGTGMFKFPPMLAARVTARVLKQIDQTTQVIELVRLCVASEHMAKLYMSALQQTESELDPSSDHQFHEDEL